MTTPPNKGPLAIEVGTVRRLGIAQGTEIELAEVILTRTVEEGDVRTSHVQLVIPLEEARSMYGIGDRFELVLIPTSSAFEPDAVFPVGDPEGDPDAG